MRQSSLGTSRLYTYDVNKLFTAQEKFTAKKFRAVKNLSSPQSEYSPSGQIEPLQTQMKGTYNYFNIPHAPFLISIFL